MSEHNHESYNVSNLMYHFIFPTKYRRVVVSEGVDEVIKETFPAYTGVVNLSTQTSHIDNPYILI